MCDCDICANNGVRTAAGVTQFTRISVSASSLPRDLVSAITAALLALYADAFGLPSLPATEAMLTMRPKLRARIGGTTARQQLKTPCTLTANTRLQASIG